MFTVSALIGFDKMPSWIQIVVLDWLAKLTFTTSDVRKVKEDTEEKATKFLELFKTRKAPGNILFYFSNNALQNF